MTKHNPKTALVADAEFVLSECARLNDLIRQTKPGERGQLLSKDAFLFSLPSPIGFGQIPCGRKALNRLHKIAIIALDQSDAAGKVEAEKVLQALKREFVYRFIKEKRSPNISQIERAMAASVKAAKRLCSDAVHFIPCRLMYDKGLGTFAIGPVMFKEYSLFEDYLKLYSEFYLEAADSPQQHDLCAHLLDDAKIYYDSFTWVAEIKIRGCDPEISKERAYFSVSAAVDILHILFGSYHTQNMMAGGVRMAEDRRARKTMCPS